MGCELRFTFLGNLFLLYFVLTANGAPKPEPDAHDEIIKCNFHFEKRGASDKVFHECVDKLGLNGKIPNLKAPIKEIDQYYATLKANKFDDKCLLKCILDKLNLSNEDGFLDKKELAMLQKGNLTKSVVDQTTELLQTCETKIGSMPEFDQKSGKTEEVLCKKLAALDECLYTGSKNFKEVC